MGNARSVVELLYLYPYFLEPFGSREACNGTGALLH